MDFDKLSKEEKIAFWREVERGISQCLALCEDFTSEEDANEIRKNLAHNELGIALESLAHMIMVNKWKISDQARSRILKTFRKMEYEESDAEFYSLFQESTNAI